MKALIYRYGFLYVTRCLFHKKSAVQFDLITTLYRLNAGPGILMLMRHKYLNNFRMLLDSIACYTHRKIINIFLVKKTTDINCYISKSRPGSHHSHQKAQKKGEKRREHVLITIPENYKNLTQYLF